MKIECRSGSLRARTLLAFGVMTAGTGTLSAQTTDVIYLNGNHDAVQSQYLGGGDLEGELNCDEVVFVRSGVRAISQNSTMADAGYSATIRHLSKTLFNEAVVWHGGNLNAALVSGQMYGVEFDWFFPNGTQPPTVDRLAAEAEVYGTRPDGSTGLIAKVYAYDAAQYALRKAVVESSVGHPLDSYRVWTEDVLTNPAYVFSPIRISGAGNDVYGYARSGKNFSVTGPTNALQHGLGYVGNLTLEPSSTAWFTDVIANAPAPSIPFSEADARALAQSAGTYYPGGLTITDIDPPADGLLFAEGAISVSCNGLARSWTLVSATGRVKVVGDGNAIEAYHQDVIGLSYANKVIVGGDGNTLVGELLAPQGSFEVRGSINTLMGIFLGNGVLITGGDNVLSDGTHPYELP